MLVEQVPELGPLLREYEIGADEAAQPVPGGPGGIGIGEPAGELIEQSRLDDEEQIVEIFEDVIERAGRIADAFGDLARRQAFKAVLLDDRGCRLDDQLAQLIGRVYGASAHLIVIRTLVV